MIAPRRFLPSISSLLALEAVDRLGSASAAAQELSLTQSAISRQLRAMEDQMEVHLIDRANMRLGLTPAGREYAASVRVVLNQMAQASLKLKANPTGGSLNLSILPAFGVNWLAPRLKGFSDLYPEVTININTRLRPFDFTSESFHAAIHFGARDWPGVHYLPLLQEQVIAVGGKDLLQGVPRQPGDLLTLPLLHLETRAQAWGHWFASNGVETADLSGMLFDQFATMIQAAVHGLGVALVPTYLAQEHLSAGRLIEAAQSETVSLGSYYLVWHEGKDHYEPLQKFRKWISTQI